jgi:hypothetical protein
VRLVLPCSGPPPVRAPPSRPTFPRYWVNDVDLGVAFTGVASVDGAPLAPAVCLGSARGDRVARVSLVTPSARTFSPAFVHPALVLDPSERSVRAQPLPAAVDGMLGCGSWCPGPHASVPPSHVLFGCPGLLVM